MLIGGFTVSVNILGAIEVDIDAELAQLGPTGYRPCAPATPCSDHSPSPRARLRDCCVTA